MKTERGTKCRSLAAAVFHPHNSSYNGSLHYSGLLYGTLATGRRFPAVRHIHRPAVSAHVGLASRGEIAGLRVPQSSSSRCSAEHFGDFVLSYYRIPGSQLTDLETLQVVCVDLSVTVGFLADSIDGVCWTRALRLPENTGASWRIADSNEVP